MKMWLVGAGYWGSKLIVDLEKLGVQAKIIDVKNQETINNIDTADPVILATPLWQHYEQTCELLKRGHDVYVEKPMAETAMQIHNIKQCIRTGQIVMVGHLFVHHPQMHLIQQQIKSGLIGDVQHITSRRLNWGIYQTKTDPLLSLATHDITIVETICNQSLIVNQAMAWNYSNNSQSDRVCFSGNAGPITFDIDVSWYWPVRTRQTVVLGTNGQIVWDQDSNTVTMMRNIIKNNRAIADNCVTLMEYDFDKTPLQAELNHWIQCVKNRRQPLTGINQAMSVARTIEQVKNLI